MRWTVDMVARCFLHRCEANMTDLGTPGLMRFRVPATRTLGNFHWKGYRCNRVYNELRHDLQVGV